MGFVKCQRNMVNAIATEEDFAIQYNDTIVCDVCKEVIKTDLWIVILFIL